MSPLLHGSALGRSWRSDSDNSAVLAWRIFNDMMASSFGVHFAAWVTILDSTWPSFSWSKWTNDGVCSSRWSDPVSMSRISRGEFRAWPCASSSSTSAAPSSKWLFTVNDIFFSIATLFARIRYLRHLWVGNLFFCDRKSHLRVDTVQLRQRTPVGTFLISAPHIYWLGE